MWWQDVTCNTWSLGATSPLATQGRPSETIEFQQQAVEMEERERERVKERKRSKNTIYVYTYMYAYDSTLF